MVPDKQSFKQDWQCVLCDMVSWKGHGWYSLDPSIQNSWNVLKMICWRLSKHPGAQSLPVGGFRKCCALSVGVFVHAWYESLWFQAASGGELIGELANKRALLSLRICTIHRTWLETSNEYNKRSCRESLRFRTNFKWYFSKNNPISRKRKAK